jgi:hypothetical protein
MYCSQIDLLPAGVITDANEFLEMDEEQLLFSSASAAVVCHIIAFALY